jgi:predicted O-linked N-acetylglucosamine transferase (SPINDLY family)
LRERDVHIAIDLAGLTLGSRPSLFALRIAPVQVNFLGYPGSTGFDFMDYIVADANVVPTGEEVLYSEQVLRMPHSYLPFDDGRAVASLEGGRIAAGLPPEGVVFCAFNNGFKIRREVFEIWMQLLHEVQESVLWLRSMGPSTAAHLKRAAAACGIPPDRLVFAPFEPRAEQHLARLALADLFLDTLPYNAHTTAAEALWAGVPVVSCAGRSFAGRVGASLLSACALSELVCSSLPDYHRLALDLARSPERRARLRAQLLGCKAAAPVFDTRRFTRDLENLLLGIDPRNPGLGFES